MNKRTIGIAIALLAVIVILFGAYALSQSSKQGSNKPQATQLSSADTLKSKLETAIKNQTTSEDEATKQGLINSVKTLDEGWYLVTINMPSQLGSTSYSLVRKDNDGSLTLMQDDTTGFDIAKMRRLKVPELIITQLPQDLENEN